MRQKGLGLIIVMVMVAGVSGQSQTPRKFLSGPLVIEDQGSFFIGGVQKVTTFATAPPSPPPGASAASPPAPGPQQITIGQMYVQFQVPAKKYGVGWPVIMVHGSSHTGACLEATPDGREGWYPYMVRNGIPSYVVDQAGRGRSGFDESVIHEGEARVASGNLKGAAEILPSFGRSRTTAPGLPGLVISSQMGPPFSRARSCRTQTYAIRIPSPTHISTWRPSFHSTPSMRIWSRALVPSGPHQVAPAMRMRSSTTSSWCPMPK